MLWRARYGARFYQKRGSGRAPPLSLLSLLALGNPTAFGGAMRPWEFRERKEKGGKEEEEEKEKELKLEYF